MREVLLNTRERVYDYMRDARLTEKDVEQFKHRFRFVTEALRTGTFSKFTSKFLSLSPSRGLL
jgi:hypothetical protein